MTDVLSYMAALLAFLTSLQATTVLAIAASVGAVVSSFAAVASWRAVQANRKAFEGKLLSDLMNEYAEGEMGKALLAVRNHLDNASENTLDPEQRRRVSHYFQKVHRLHEARLISEAFARHAIGADQAALFLRMEPLERRLNRERNIAPRFDTSPFEFYAKLHRLPRTTEGAAP